MNWINTNINLGRVKEKSKTTFEFKSIEDLDITIVKVGCGGCTFVKTYKNKKLPVTFKADSIPKHLRHKKYQPISKTISVVYKDGSREVLTFTATIII